MPALKTWLHPAVWFCIPLNVGQEAAARSQQSPPALLAAGDRRTRLRSCGGHTTGQREPWGELARGPRAAPTTARCTYALPGHRKGWLQRTPLFFQPIQLCGRCVIHNNTTALPHPQKTHKNPNLRTTSPTNSIVEPQTPPLPAQAKHLLSSSVLAFLLTPFVRSFDSVSKFLVLKNTC